MPIRVLHIIGSLGLGGAQIMLKQIAENADQAGIENFIYPLRTKGEKISVSAEIIRKPMPNYDPRKFITILQLCTELRIDLIHAHLHKAVIASLLAAPKLNIPVIVHEHGPVCRSGPQFALYRCVLRRLRKRPASVIAVSEYIADILKKQIGIDKNIITVLPNAVDFKPFDECRLTKLQARRKLDFPENRLILGFTGRLNPVKGPDIAIKTLKELKSSFPDCFLVLAGEGKLRDDLEKLARSLDLSDSVRFLGFQSDTPAVIAACDIGLIPSRQEPFGIVALEWMRMKIPVITSGTGGLGEILTDNQTALVVPENTPAASANSLIKLTNTPGLREIIVQRAWERTLELEIGPYMVKLNDLYKKLLTAPA